MNPAKILVVEDESLLRNLYQRVLAEADFEVVTAKDGQEAEETIRNQEFDMILLDLMLPKKSGIDILKALKSEPPTIPLHKIVLLTNVVDERQLMELKDDHVIGVLNKAEFTPSSLTAKIRQLLWWLVFGF